MTTINNDDLNSIVNLINQLNSALGEASEIYVENGSELSVISINGYRLGKLVYNGDHDDWDFNPSEYGNEDV